MLWKAQTSSRTVSRILELDNGDSSSTLVWEVLEQAGKRLRLIEAHGVATGHGGEFGDGALAFWWRDNGGTEGAMKADALP